MERGFWYIARLLKGGPLLLANSGVASFRLAYSVDVARAYLQASQAGAHGKTYNLAQSEIITLRDYVEESARALGTKPELVNVPRELLGEMGGPHADLINHVPDITAAAKDFGFHPTPWPEAAKVSAIWFRDSWKGDEAKLLKTRPQEIDFAKRWMAATSSLR